MKFTPLAIRGVWLLEPEKHEDDRGYFYEQFRGTEFLAATGSAFTVRQINQSKSRKGVVRGLHYTIGAGKQAKIVTCSVGKILDFILDTRPDSDTFGQSVHVELSSANSHSLFIEGGLAHGFLALDPVNVVTYLCDSEYSPSHEVTVNPLDSALNLPLHSFAALHDIRELILSPKDREAPNLQLNSES